MANEFVWDKAALEELLNSSSGPIGKKLKQLGIRVQTAAKRNASGRPGPNVQTGRLRSSIAEELSHDAEGLVERVGTDVEYAIYVEMGTSHAPAYPFLRPAADSIRDLL